MGNFGQLVSPETVVTEPVDTKAIKMSLEDARLGRVIGKNGLHIKALGSFHTSLLYQTITIRIIP